MEGIGRACRRITLICIAMVLPSVTAIGTPGAGHASASGATSQPLEETYIVPTRHGKLYVEVVRPTNNGRDLQVPAILTMSPYSVLGRNGDADEWWPRGYARVWVDVVGTGNSGGCYDYGGRREKETGYDIVEWIADRKWSNGKVGMIGGSYNGTTAIATAVTRPPHLTTIVPEAAISRWYEYAFSGGIRYFWTNEMVGHQGPGSAADEGFDTPLAFDFGFAIPPPLDGGAGWAERVESTITPCEELEHTLHGYDFDTPNYGRFWLERDYIKDAGDIDIPVLIAHNWGDWNVKQEEAINLYRALDKSPNRRLYLGTRWDGHGTPGGDYDAAVRGWFAHYLKAVANGADRLAAVTSQMSDSNGPAGWYAGDWPRTRRVTLFPQHVDSASGYEWQLLTRRPWRRGPEAEFASTGANTETFANAHNRSNSNWFWFETPPLQRDTRIFGNIEVRIFSTVNREWVTFTPTIVDVDPGSRAEGIVTDPAGLVSTTRGWLDSRYRRDLRAPHPIEPGRPFGMTVVTKPQDYTFKAGHRIGLNIQTEIADWSVPKPYPNCADPNCALVRINWERGKTRVVLPVVEPRGIELFSLD